MRGMGARLSGRFWTVGVSGRSAVVAWGPSVRGRTQQETLAGPSARVSGMLGWLVGEGEVGGPVADGAVRLEENGSQSCQGAIELSFPEPAPGQMQGGRRSRPWWLAGCGRGSGAAGWRWRSPWWSWR